LSTKYIYIFCVIFRIKRDFLHKNHQQIYVYNREEMYFLQ
jgi:hypothetical protein